MSKKQLFLFSSVLFLMFGNGSGFVTLVPVHLSRLGIAPDRIGYLFSLLYFGMASSGILAGWLTDHFQQRKLLSILSASGQIAAGLLMWWGVESFPLLSFALFLSWFLAGVHSALVSTLVGLQAHESERGRVFGTIGFITGLGPVVSGFLYGRLVDQHGIEILLVLNIAISIVWTILSLFYEEPALPTVLQATGGLPTRPALPASFYLVVIAAILGWFSVNGGKLGITLIMSQRSFSANEISLTVGLASVVALLVPLLLGWLSDHTGRKPLLLMLNLLGLAGLFLISRSNELAGFTAASSLLSLYSCFSGLFNALITDLVPRGSLGFGLSLINGTSYIAGIFSSALMGLTINLFGSRTPFLLAMLLPLTAAILLTYVQEMRRNNLALEHP